MGLVSWCADRGHVACWHTVHKALIVTSRCKCFLKVFINVGLAIVCTNIFVIIKVEYCHSDIVSSCICTQNPALWKWQVGSGMKSACFPFHHTSADLSHFCSHFPFWSKIPISLSPQISFVLRVSVENWFFFYLNVDSGKCHIYCIFSGYLIMLSITRLYSVDNRTINECGAGGRKYWEEACLSATLFTKIPTWPDLG
jgi:hypothetical protein